MLHLNTRAHHVVVTKLLLFFLSGWSLLSTSASATEFVRPRPLMEYEDIMLAQELGSALSALNDNLASCIDSGTTNPNECRCQFPEEVQTAELSYEKVVSARPKWKGKILFWKNPTNLQSQSLVIPAIEDQLKASTSSCDSTHGSK